MSMRAPRTRPKRRSTHAGPEQFSLKESLKRRGTNPSNACVEPHPAVKGSQKTTRRFQDRFTPILNPEHAFKITKVSQIVEQRRRKLHRRSFETYAASGTFMSRSMNGTVIPPEYNGHQHAYAVPAIRAPFPAGDCYNMKMMGDDEDEADDMIRHENRIAMALGLKQHNSVLEYSPKQHIRHKDFRLLHTWGQDETWITVLDAPKLRDDFYCSLIAYSPRSHALAVSLNQDVFFWYENKSTQQFPTYGARVAITSLAFSSDIGGHNILAIGKIDGSVQVWQVGETLPRVEASHRKAIACLSWKPTTTKRYNLAPSNQPYLKSETLIVGDEIGQIFVYAVHWNYKGPDGSNVIAHMCMIQRFRPHTSQICGIAWSPDGEQMVTGGNNNSAVVYNVKPNAFLRVNEPCQEIQAKYKFAHNAAVKALAFCPWQKNILATGGGSNDRCIRFFNTRTGMTLSTIDVSAQVTSLLWSTKHKEICATFGFTNPEHSVRIAVFSFPDCRKIATIPWGGDTRALYALPYPGDPFSELEGRSGARRTEACIVIAASDESIRFHQVWRELPQAFKERKTLANCDVDDLMSIDLQEDVVIR